MILNHSICLKKTEGWLFPEVLLSKLTTKCDGCQFYNISKQFYTWNSTQKYLLEHLLCARYWLSLALRRWMNKKPWWDAWFYFHSHFCFKASVIVMFRISRYSGLDQEVLLSCSFYQRASMWMSDQYYLMQCPLGIFVLASSFYRVEAPK